MANHVIALGVASLVSFLVGSAASLIFVSESLEGISTTSTREPDHVLLKQLAENEARLVTLSANLDRQLDTLRRDIRNAGSSASAGAHRSAPTTTRPVSANAAAAAAPGYATRDEPGTLPVRRLDALAPLEAWQSDSDVRNRWLLTSQDATLDAFGAPDELMVHEGEEWWSYWIEDASDDNLITSEYRLRFHAGRLVSAQHVEWKKPRAKPGGR